MTSRVEQWRMERMTDSSMHADFQALVIDKESRVRDFVATVLREEGWKVTQSASAEDALQRVDEAFWSVVFCDVMLGGASGYSVLRYLKEKKPETRVVLMSANGGSAGVLDPNAFGVYDYFLKPVGPSDLQSLSRTLQDQLTQQPRRRSPARRTAAYHSEIELVGRSHAFIEVMKQVGRVAKTDLPVLLTGESGTGKELVAAAIHQQSGRSEQPFVVVDCSAISSRELEAEIFGYVKGAFAGADRDRRGLWEEAEGGTIFLDEITETNSAFQVKVLRALQMGEIHRVGSNETQRVNVRVIAASSGNVQAEVTAGRFRNDLFNRLNDVSMVLPPLRERREDIPPLAQSFADRVYSLSPAVTFSTEALALLQEYNWPGNVRELETAVVRAVAICDGTVRPTDLSDCVRNHGSSTGESTTEKQEEWVTLSVIEGRYVARVLEHTCGNKQAAARLLAIDRKTLDRMIKRHHIDAQHARALRAKPSTRG